MSVGLVVGGVAVLVIVLVAGWIAVSASRRSGAASSEPVREQAQSGTVEEPRVPEEMPPAAPAAAAAPPAPVSPDPALRQDNAILDQSKLVVHALLQSVTESLETFLDGSTSYGDTLEGHKSAIRKALDTAGIREWQEAMETELDKMQSSNAQYRQQLDAANQKLKEQQEELVRLQSDAGMDFLTKIPNRRSFDKRVTEEISRVDRYGGTFSMVVFDVDHFKSINDTYGHLAGDRILRALAKVLDEQRRASDFLARYGGEEFVLLLPQTNLDQARQLAENSREKLDRSKFRCENHSIRVTVSAGVGELTAGTDTPESLFERVDSALYAAKEGGRNRVEAVYFESVSD